MIIGKPVVSTVGGEVIVEATVEMQRAGDPLPPKLFFACPERFAPWVSDGGDGFVTGLLPLAMKRHEDVVVHADLSIRLARGLREYQQFQTAWKPEKLTEASITPDRLVQRDRGASAGACGTSFSGGIDSFYTLHAHLGANEPLPAYRVTHCLLINGFDSDSDIEKSGHFAALERMYGGIAAKHQLEFVTVRTNLLDFLGLSIQKLAFTAFVAAPVLVLGRLFASYYIPASYHFLHLGRVIDGSHPGFDHLLATEATEIIHDGGHLTRVQKTLAIADWPDTWDTLRVCRYTTRMQKNGEIIANCCLCEKCIRTITTLEAAGKLSNYRCFPRPYDGRAVRPVDYGAPGQRVFAEEIVEFATRQGRHDVARDLKIAMRGSSSFRPRLRRWMLASYQLEQRSRLWAAVMRYPKKLVKAAGLGAGWLHSVPYGRRSARE